MVFAQDAKGVGQKIAPGSWIFDPSVLKASLKLPLETERFMLPVPTEHILKRTKLFNQDPRIEPITLTIKHPYESSIRKVARDYAASSYLTDALAAYLRHQPAGIYPLPKRLKLKKPLLKRVIIGHDALSLIDLGKLQQKLASPSHTVRIDGKKLSKNHHLTREFLAQLRPFFSHPAMTEMARQIEQKSIIGERLFLSRFARKMLRKHVLYRGLNCFHAAMAFQDPSLLTMSRTNLREERGHHHLMINHDEIWHILNWYFYEIDPEKSPLKYGDVMVFLDVPGAHEPTRPAAYPWIVHASAYLFNNLVYSKGSKSPNTAYTIKTLEEEWSSWSRHTDRLALKVYRKNYIHLGKKTLTLSRNDWLQ